MRNKLLLFLLVFVVLFPLAEATDCFSFTDQNSCEAGGCLWETHGGAHCEQFSCFAADNTNQTFCETTLNQTFNLSCGWEIHGTGFCDPLGGDFFGNGCSDFNGSEQGCYGTFFCEWNATDSTCNEPPGGFGSGGPGSQNPPCAVLTDTAACGNISGCTWDGTACSGNPGGIQCDQLNKSICADFTLLSTCCSWNGTTCTTSFNQDCYNSIPPLPSGATFCEDTNSFMNQTLCEQIASSPWYMPCKWFNDTQECHFNSDAFGDFGSFDEIGTELGCEAQGGIWKSEQFSDPVNGVVKTDSWCEFNFGSGGNCDASCWACENGATSLANAQTLCEGSALGYCEFQQDANAFNSYGWCNPKQEFIEGGGKSCDDDCAACEFLLNPEQQCSESFHGCVWVNESTAPNGVGFCFGHNEKHCGNDCFSCYSQSECASGDGGNNACTWDNSNQFCKPTGFSGEICFDGIDNDGDAAIDCTDPQCATDKFCGGEQLSEVYGDCPSFTPQGNSTCVTNGCVWIQNEFDMEFGGGGFCDFPGAQCWEFDGDNTSCIAETGCTFLTGGTGFCEENETVLDNCFPQQNETACSAIDTCQWISFGGNGFCEGLPFAQCEANSSRQASQAACEMNVTINGNSTQICGWDSFGPPGHKCEILCFLRNAGTCGDGTNGLCEVVNGICEPESFGANCFISDGNQTMCNGELNATCTYFPDQNAGNGVAPDNVDGWCDPKGDAQFIQFFGEQHIVILGTDADDPVNDSFDIGDVGLKDDFDKFILGINIQDEFVESGTCNGVPTSVGTGTGVLNYTFYWYVDADGNTTNNCAARDNSSQTGYEFSFKYQSTWNGSALSEVKVSSQCVGGNWGPVPIPLTSNSQIMCDNIGGGMAGIDKAELFKFKDLYNKSEDVRFYATVSNVTTNDSVVTDTAGPFFYTPGAFDFKFEDCANPGSDADGDGLTASNDPDCFDFLKFGFVPTESGFQCNDGIDNDADGLTDCSDTGCDYDPFFCGGALVADPNDNTAPNVIWQKVDTFPDSAHIVYDTNEPANGTTEFYFNDSSCTTLNATIRDVGIYDSFVSTYKLWHDGPLDNFANNPENIGFSLTNATTYYYKTKVCDISDNCAVSACLNFTTKANFNNCKGCTSTFNFPFTPPSGADSSDPLGNLNFKFQLPDGTESDLGANANAGTQLNYTQTKNFNLVIENPNATNQSHWRVTLVNASVTGKVASGIQNFTANDDINFNSTTNGTFVGLGTTKCQELVNIFRPSKLEIGIPGNVSELWQCTASLANCTEKTANATRILYNETLNTTLWQVPAEWGC